MEGGSEHGVPQMVLRSIPKTKFCLFFQNKGGLLLNLFYTLLYINLILIVLLRTPEGGYVVTRLVGRLLLPLLLLLHPSGLMLATGISIPGVMHDRYEGA